MKSLGIWVSIAAIGLAAVWAPSPVRAQEAAELPNRAVAPAANAVAEDPLAVQVDQAIAITSRRFLNADVHTPWQIMHGILALRQDFQIKKGDQKVSALEWIAGGATYQGLPWFEVTPYGGRAHPYTVPYAFEGHPNQFLAILTMSNLPLDHKFKAGNGGVITIANMIKNAQMEVNSAEEITWTLWALSRYVDPDAQWTNKYGEQWSMERLVQMQTYASVEQAACGGTHGLYALSSARNAYIQTRRPLRGVWLEADQKIRRYVVAAQSLQNSDGSFSASFFQGPNYSTDFGTRLASSGHTLEMLMIALPRPELDKPWLRRGVQAVAKDLIDHRKAAADCGPLYHALHALVLYRERTRPETTTAQAEQGELPANAAITETAPKPDQSGGPVQTAEKPLIESPVGSGANE